MKMEEDINTNMGDLTRCNAVLYIPKSEILSDTQSNPADTAAIIDSIQQFQEFVTDEINNIKSRLDLITEQNEKLIKIHGQNTTLIGKLLKKELKMRTESDDLYLRFPIKDKDGLQKMEDDIAKMEEEFVVAIRTMMDPGGLKKNLSRLFGTEIIMNFNYDGIKNKESFKDYKKVANVLFKALRKDGYSMEDFTSDIRQSFRLHKNRFFKAKCIQRKNDALKAAQFMEQINQMDNCHFDETDEIPLTPSRKKHPVKNFQKKIINS